MGIETALSKSEHPAKTIRYWTTTAIRRLNCYRTCSLANMCTHNVIKRTLRPGISVEA